MTTLDSVPEAHAFSQTYKERETNNCRMNFRSVLLRLLLLIPLISCSGCAGALVAALARSSNPRFAEVEKSWPALAADKGRVVIFYPKDDGNGSLCVDEVQGPIMPRMFAWIDLPAGRHVIRRVPTFGRKLGPPQFEFSVLPNSITFIRHSSSANDQIVDRAAIPDLDSLQNVYGTARMWTGR